MLGYTGLLSMRTMKRHAIKEIYSSDTGFNNVPTIRRVFHELRDEEGYKEFLNLLKG